MHNARDSIPFSIAHQVTTQGYKDWNGSANHLHTAHRAHHVCICVCVTMTAVAWMCLLQDLGIDTVIVLKGGHCDRWLGY